MTSQIMLILLTILISPVFAWSHGPASGPSLEYQIKAAFIYNFTEFVEWPAESSVHAGHALTIGVLGKDPFGDALALAIKGKTAHGKSLVLRHFARIEDVKRCDLLFISRGMLGQLDKIRRLTDGQHVLTVADHPLVRETVVITLVIQDNKVRFQIDLDAAEAAGLTISSKLLSLAQVVRRNRETRE